MPTVRPQYFFNPNAAPEILYPLVPLLIALGDNVAIWQPEEELIEQHSNPGWWMSALGHPLFRDRIQVMSAQWRVEKYKKDQLSGAILRNIDSNPKMRIRSDRFKLDTQIVSDILWKGLSDQNRDEIKAELALMQSDINATSNDLSEGMERRSKEIHQGEIPRTLFDSVIQDLFMVVVSGSHFPLCKAERWNAYSKIVNSIDQSQNRNSRQAESSSHVRIADDLMSKIEDKGIILDSDQENFKDKVKWFNFKNDLKSMDFSEYIRRFPEIQKQIDMFSVYENAAMSAPFLEGDLASRSVQIIKAIRTRNRSFIGLIDAIGKGSKFSELITPTDDHWLLALITGASELSSYIFSIPVVSKLIDGMIGTRYRGIDTKIVIRNQAFWEGLANDSKGE